MTAAPAPFIRPPRPERHPSLVSAEQLFIAEHMGNEQQDVQDLDTDNTSANRGKVTHITDEKVRMWKPTPAGYRPRWVPTGLIYLNLKTGWKTTCPDCGTDCGNDPNDCPAYPPAKVAYCPKAGCNHKINLRNLALDLSNDAHKNDPNAADLGYGEVDEMKMLKAAMDAHIRTRHPREANILIGPERVLMPTGF